MLYHVSYNVKLKSLIIFNEIHHVRGTMINKTDEQKDAHHCEIGHLLF